MKLLKQVGIPFYPGFFYNECMIYILYGKDESKKALEAKKLKKKYGKDAEISDFDAEKDDFTDFLYEIAANDLFGGPKFITVSNASFLCKGSKGNFDVEELQKYLPIEDTVLFLCSEKPASRKAVKQITDQAKMISCHPLTAKTAPDYILNRMNDLKIKADSKARKYILDNLGTDVLNIESQLEKLQLYGLPLSLEDAKALVPYDEQEDIFRLVDALFQRNSIKLLELYRKKRAENTEPLAIIGLLASQIRFLFQIRVFMKQGMHKEDIIEKTGAKPYRIEVSMSKASRFQPDELLKMQGDLAELEQSIKSGKIDKELGFEQFALHIGDRR